MFEAKLTDGAPLKKLIEAMKGQIKNIKLHIVTDIKEGIVHFSPSIQVDPESSTFFNG